MDQQQRSVTLDDSAQASNPGGLSVERIRWFSSYPAWPLIWLLSAALFLILALSAHWLFWIPVVLLVLMNWMYWKKVSEHFMYGCANPGIVVSLDPMLIAVATDLTKGDGEYPVVRIIRKELSSICGKPPQVGALVPTVALYYASSNPDQSHWETFDPRPVDCATSDLSEAQRIANSFSKEDIEELKRWLSQVPKPYKPGLYPIQL